MAEAAPDERREDTAFDVFEPHGTYLATCGPEDFAAYPHPVFDGLSPLPVTRDELGVERVVRHRLSRCGQAVATAY